jgi:hypothetical protein
LDRHEIAAALKRLAGTERVLIYDVSEDEAPTRAVPTTPFVHGGNRRRFIGDAER